MNGLLLLALLLVGFVTVTVAALACLIAWRRAEREADELRQRLTAARVRDLGDRG